MSSSKQSISNLDDKQHNRWSEEEDERLRHAVQQYGESKWKLISEYVGSRDNLQCRQRWIIAIKPTILKGKWSKEEDDQLVEAIKIVKQYRWADIAKFLPNRTSKQCRERWFHYLCPDINKKPFSREEDALLYELYEKYGGKWAKIAAEMDTGRTECKVRMRYMILQRQRLASKSSAMANNSQLTHSSSSSDLDSESPPAPAATTSSSDISNQSVYGDSFKFAYNYPASGAMNPIPPTMPLSPSLSYPLPFFMNSNSMSQQMFERSYHEIPPYYYYQQQLPPFPQYFPNIYPRQFDPSNR